MMPLTFSGPTNEELRLQRLKIIEELKQQHPEMSKMMKLIEKKAVVESISYAGNGSFNHEGRFQENKVGNYKYAMVYFFRDVFEDDLSKIDIDHDKWKPKKFVWCFDQIHRNKALTSYAKIELL